MIGMQKRFSSGNVRNFLFRWQHQEHYLARQANVVEKRTEVFGSAFGGLTPKASRK